LTSGASIPASGTEDKAEMIHPDDAAEFLLDYAARVQEPKIQDALAGIAERLRSMGFGGYTSAHRANDLQLLTDQAATQQDPAVARRLNEVAGLIRERF
jgi:hypothetical protein